MSKASDSASAAAGRAIGNWLFLFFRAWLVMLALGGFAHEAGYDVALGYWAVVLGLLVIRLTLSGIAVNTLTFFDGKTPTRRANPRHN